MHDNLNFQSCLLALNKDFFGLIGKYCFNERPLNPVIDSSIYNWLAGARDFNCKFLAVTTLEKFQLAVLQVNHNSLQMD